MRRTFAFSGIAPKCNFVSTSTAAAASRKKTTATPSIPMPIARPIATAVKIAAISRAVPGTERKRTSANVPATASPVPMLPLTIIITSATDIGRSASVSAKDAVCLQPRVNTSAVKMPSTSADARHSSSAETVSGVGRIEVSSESRRMFNFSFVVPFVRHRANIRRPARKVVQIACAVLGERRHIDFVSAQ